MEGNKEMYSCAFCVWFTRCFFNRLRMEEGEAGVAPEASPEAPEASQEEEAPPEEAPSAEEGNFCKSVKSFTLCRCEWLPGVRYAGGVKGGRGME